MKRIAAWLIPLIPLAAACAAHAQEQPELQAALMPVAVGCNDGWCANSVYQVQAEQVAPASWRAFRLHPVIGTDQRAIRQQGSPSEWTEFTHKTVYLLVREEQSWVQKISRIEELPLFTFWQTSGSKIFFGVNSDGFAGLNYSQKIRPRAYRTDTRSDSLASRPVGPLSPPLVHAQSLTYEKKDLSGASSPEAR